MKIQTSLRIHIGQDHHCRIYYLELNIFMADNNEIEHKYTTLDGPLPTKRILALNGIHAEDLVRRSI